MAIEPTKVAKREWHLMVEALKGPGRWLAIANIYFLTAVGLVTLALVVLLFYKANTDPYAPLEYEVPQQIVGAPIVKRGEIIVIRGTKCNTHAESINVDTVSYWDNLDTGDSVRYNSGSTKMKPGCTTKEYENLVPSDLPAGNYQLSGRGVSVSGGEFQLEEWHTEQFIVTE